MLTVKELCQQSNISQQTFYRLIKTSKEFSNLIENKREKRGNSYRYDKEVLEWILNYYDKETECGEAAKEATEQPSEAAREDTQINLLKAENAHLKEKIEELKKQYEKAEEERKFLLQETGRLTMLLGEEKQEKQLLLPPAKTTLSTRIKNLLHLNCQK